MKSLQKINKAILFMLLFTAPAYCIGLLHPGVLINGTELETEMYLLSATELQDFLVAKSNAKALQELCDTKDVLLGEYNAAVASLTLSLDKSIAETSKAAKSLSKCADDKALLLSENKALRRRNKFKRAAIYLLGGFALSKL